MPAWLWLRPPTQPFLVRGLSRHLGLAVDPGMALEPWVATRLWGAGWQAMWKTHPIDHGAPICMLLLSLREGSGWLRPALPSSSPMLTPCAVCLNLGGCPGLPAGAACAQHGCPHAIVHVAPLSCRVWPGRWGVGRTRTQLAGGWPTWSVWPRSSQGCRSHLPSSTGMATPGRAVRVPGLTCVRSHHGFLPPTFPPVVTGRAGADSCALLPDGK